MDPIAKRMMQYIGLSVCGKPVENGEQEPVSEEVAHRLYALSNHHDCAHLVGAALDQMQVFVPGETGEKFRKQTYLAVYRYERINYELQQIYHVLEECKIPFLPLKGSVIRQYYPEPWMRTSCDIDILVRKEDMDAAGFAVCKKLSYKKVTQTMHDVSYQSESGVHLELHFSLIESDRIGKAEKLLENIWEYATPSGSKYMHALPDEMFYYYHIAHMAKHFVGGGCGIRPFLDLWILNHKVSHDQTRREALLKEGGLLDFARSAERLSELWFGEGKADELVLQMEEYILSSGVYGNKENRILVSRAKSKSKFRYWLGRVFMPYGRMITVYPKLAKHPYLLPYYQVVRWFTILFGKRRKKIAEELRVNRQFDSSEKEGIVTMLNRLGLQ